MTEQRPFEKAAIPQSDRGKRLKQRDYLPEGRIPVIDQGQSLVGGFTDDEDMAFVGEFPVILFGDHTRAVKYVERQFAVGADGIKIFRPAPDVSPKYLFYWMRSARIPDRGYGRHYQYLRQLTVPVPSASQQVAIVAEIEKQFSRLDEAVANLKRVKANLKRYKAAVLKAAVEGRLVPTEAELARKADRPYETGSELKQRLLDTPPRECKVRRKHMEQAEADMTSLPRLPTGWTWARLADLSHAVGGYAFQSDKFTDTGYQVVKMANVRMDLLDLSQRPSFIEDVSLDVVAKFSLTEGDILMTLTGTRRQRDYGYVAVVRHQKKLLVNQRVARLRPMPAIHGGFLALVLQSEQFRDKFFAGETGNVGQGNVSMQAVTQELVPLAPVVEQIRIVEEFERRLSLIRGAEAQVDLNLARAAKLRQSTLSAAFSSQ